MTLRLRRRVAPGSSTTPAGPMLRAHLRGPSPRAGRPDPGAVMRSRLAGVVPRSGTEETGENPVLCRNREPRDDPVGEASRELPPDLHHELSSNSRWVISPSGPPLDPAGKGTS